MKNDEILPTGNLRRAGCRFLSTLVIETSKMRLLLLSFLLFMIHCADAQKFTGYRQKGYGQVSFSMYGNNDVIAKPGLSIGAGALLGHNITTGAGFDIYMFNGF